MRRWLFCALLCGCGDDATARDLAVPDSGADLAGLDLAAGDASASDLAGSDGGGCIGKLGSTHLYEDACPQGGTICFIDHVPTDFF